MIALCFYIYAVLPISFTSYSPFKKIVLSFLCISIHPAVGGDQSVRLSRRILDSSLMYFFQILFLSQVFLPVKNRACEPSFSWFPQRMLAYALAIHTGKKRHLFTLSPTSCLHGEVPMNALAFPLLLAL